VKNSDLWTPPRGLLAELGERIKKYAEEYGVPVFPDLRNMDCITVASDYSGQEKSERFYVYSFLFADLTITHSSDWYSSRLCWRRNFLPDGRRMTYKDLDHDQVRDRALSPYLSAVNTIDGMVVTIAIHKEVTSILELIPEKEQETFRSVKPEIREKMLWIIHFFGFFIAGLSRSGQSVWWCSDYDDIVATDERISMMTQKLREIMSQYLPHRLGHLHVMTTARNPDDDPRRQRDLLLWYEDLVSIPDLVAGAFSDQLTTLKTKYALPTAGTTIDLPRTSLKNKTACILDWYVDSSQRLKRHAWVIMPSYPPPKCTIANLHVGV